MAYGLHNMQRALCPGYQVGTALMDELRDTTTQGDKGGSWRGGDWEWLIIKKVLDGHIAAMVQLMQTKMITYIKKPKKKKKPKENMII